MTADGVTARPGAISPDGRARAIGWLLAGLFIISALAILAMPHLRSVRGSGLAQALRQLYTDSLYQRVAIFANYIEDGFIRRGLSGTIPAVLSPDPELRALWFVLFSVAFCIVPLALLVRRLGASTPEATACYLTAVLGVSPQTFLGWSHDVGRTDLLVGGFIAWSVVAALDRRRWLSVLILLVGLLAHETAFIFGAPLPLALLWQDVRMGEAAPAQRRQLILALGTGAALILSLQWFFSPPPQELAEHLLRVFPVAAEDAARLMWRDNAIYMAVGERRR